MIRPLCFVLMPFGRKPGSSGEFIDFDSVYHELIYPAVTDAGLQPLRADEEITGGFIHKPMFERLILCEYAVADLTNTNANVFYELGLRHAVRPASTILIFAEGKAQIPFDVAPLRAIPYTLGCDGRPSNTSTERKVLANRLQESRQKTTDSPVFQIVDGFPDIQRLKTDVFRDRVAYSEEIKKKLREARKSGADAVHEVETSLGNIEDTEAGVVIDLFLSYRSVSSWENMINLTSKMSPALASTIMVQEQLALALNRNGRGEDAENVLLDVLEKRGPSSETYGILGRVYKDRWDAAMKKGDKILAAGHLDKAIEAYLKGFETDWRDAYPGINAVTLMELREPPDPRRLQIMPVVAYAVERRIAAGKPDYWDHATRLELAVIAKDPERAITALSNALSSIREAWEPETTARNLRIIREARERRGELVSWAKEFEEELEKRC